MDNQKVILITGASNGMGLEAAKLFSEKGWEVVAGARRVEQIPAAEHILAVKLDVTDSQSNAGFVKTALDKFGRIDVLINNAGYGEYGPTEEISTDNAKYQFDVNYFGAVELTNLVLPTMRAQKSGRVINISSVGGDVFMPLGAHYHATKAAMQQWSDVLDLEVEPFGIRSVVIQPAGTKSAWRDVAFANAAKNLKENSPYEPLVGKLLEAFKKFSSQATSADLAQVFYKAATDTKPKSRYFNAFQDRIMTRLARVHPKIWRKFVKAQIK
ncbi:MAG: SDR family NAD(P)-dependent oxidoreductase [Streptococcaceae bacterium]|jgi:NAD(P)-dependent dehydrogenase (short-subunit alcohol dehydrogenase family)|nr:SDR family NAD(P)-dependent oxidoreductase [Streptococcaceae bacterium]